MTSDDVAVDAVDSSIKEEVKVTAEARKAAAVAVAEDKPDDTAFLPESPLGVR